MQHNQICHKPQPLKRFCESVKLPIRIQKVALVILTCSRCYKRYYCSTPYATSGGVKLTRVITTLEGFLRPYKCFITLTKQLTAVVTFITSTTGRYIFQLEQALSFGLGIIRRWACWAIEISN